MSDVSRLHANAIAALLEPLTVPPTSYQLYLGKVTVPDGELMFPYLCLWRAPADRQILNLVGTLHDHTTITQITAVGRDEDEVMAALDRAAELLVGQRPPIDGRNTGMVRQVSGNPYVTPSDDVHTSDGQGVYQGVLQVELNSTAAPTA